MKSNIPPGQYSSGHYPQGQDPRFPYGKSGRQQPLVQYPSQGHTGPGQSTSYGPATLSGPAVITDPRRKFPWWAWLVALAALVFAAFSFIPGLTSPSDWFGGSDPGQPTALAPSPTPASTSDPAESADPGQAGATPAPLGNGDMVGNWEIEMLEVNLDATDLMDDYGKSLLEPGNVVVGVKLRLTNLGSSATEPAGNLGLELRFAGQYRASYGAYYVESDDLFFLQGEVAPGEHVDTWSYFDAPKGFTSGELWILDYEDYLGDPLLITIP